MSKYVLYALLVTVLSTGVSWARFFKNVAAGSNSSFNSGSSWSSNSGGYVGGGNFGSGSGGGGGHK